MTYLQKNKDREHFLKCRVCGEDLDLRKPREVFDHNHDNLFYYQVRQLWVTFYITTPNNNPNQKANMISFIVLN